MRRDAKDFAIGLSLGVICAVLICEGADRVLRWFSGERRVRWLGGERRVRRLR